MTFLRRAALASVGLLLSAAAPASAAVTFTGSQQGDDYVFTLAGTLDISGLSGTATSLGGAPAGSVNPQIGALILLPSSELLSFDLPGSTTPFGDGDATLADSVEGDAFFVGGAFLAVAPDYVSGEMLSGALTYAGQDMASLGLTPGTYVTALPNDETLSIIIPAAEVPLPAAAPLLLGGIGALAFAARRRKA